MRNLFSTAGLALAAALAFAPAVQAQAISPPRLAAVQAGSFKLDPAHSKITWSVNHFGFSTYIGQFSSVNGTLKLDLEGGRFRRRSMRTVDAASLGTLNARARHPHQVVKRLPRRGNLPHRDLPRDEGYPDGRAHRRHRREPHPAWRDQAGGPAGDSFNQGGANPIDKKYELGLLRFSEDQAVRVRHHHRASSVVSDDVTLDHRGRVQGGARRLGRLVLAALA